MRDDIIIHTNSLSNSGADSIQKDSSFDQGYAEKRDKKRIERDGNKKRRENKKEEIRKKGTKKRKQKKKGEKTIKKEKMLSREFF